MKNFGIEPVVNVPMVKVVDENGREMYRGYYFRHENRQVCFNCDELKPEDVDHLVCWSDRADWNMPRSAKIIKVTPPHRIEIIERPCENLFRNVDYEILVDVVFDMYLYLAGDGDINVAKWYEKLTSLNLYRKDEADE